MRKPMYNRPTILKGLTDDYEGIEPVFETLPGWKCNTFGVKSLDELPQNSRNYIKKIEEVTGIPVDIISTGPDREETIILKDPFEAQ